MKIEHIPFAEIDKKWQDRWEAEGVFNAPKTPRAGKKFYCLDMFPYPSAAGLHVGHPEGYTATDILCRYRRMRGDDVLHPMGWDAFGLPAENFAIATGKHPADVTKDNVDNFRRQIKSLGFSYDWTREIDTTDPGYYKWTQWIFLQLFKKGLAFESTAPINWCPKDMTGLANEEVFNGACERCGTKVERKSLRQWVLKITAYADRLADDLAGLDWPESTLAMQRHWIGRSEGAEVSFKSEGGDEIKVFTTRPDTLFGATYMVLAPEHPLVKELTSPAQKAAVEAYVAAAQNKSDLERTELQKEKTGVATGGFAINPVNGKKIPVYIADYVLASYGTGAIMAVPAHDARDHEFATKHAIPIVKVVDALGSDGLIQDVKKEAFTGEGIAENSDFLNGLSTPEAKKKIISWLEEKKLGRKQINYKLRDWLFSRQRYWGEPIPLVHCPKDGIVPVPEDQLPVRLPEVADYKPTGTGESPLANVADWVNTKCPKCAGPAKRETNTMPQWAGSCWYYLRFIDPKNDKAAWDKELEKAWGPVDCYVGGAEHAVLHLLYARFWHKVLFDLGHVHTKEPFMKLRHQGMILSYSHRDKMGNYHPYEVVEYDEKGNAVHAQTGEVLASQIEKMSKAKKNVVNPDVVLTKYGADTFRLYEMFMGAFEQAKPWDMRSIEGSSRFLRRVWNLLPESGAAAAPGDGLVSARHRAIKKVSEDLEAFGFNTCISTLMTYCNEIQKEAVPAKVDLETLLILLNPFAPHVTEELWSMLGRKDLLCRQAWPAWDAKFLVESVIEYAVQVNGKLRSTFSIAAEAAEAAILEAALADAKVKVAVDNKTIVKKIVVPKKLVNLVVK
ncbi:MAG TPA: leucine--tRNA ligase [Elusimicrobiota bacterium]|nr:leucine--tRNA ligase [Elusimicrobiota bacterium]